MKKQNILILLLIGFLLSGVGAAYSQTGMSQSQTQGTTSNESTLQDDMDADPTDPPDDPDPLDTPIDGGLSLLIAAGIGVGAKKIHAARKK